MLKAVIFDYNGVLLDDIQYHIDAYWKAGRNMGFGISLETVRRYISYAPAQKKELYFKNISDNGWKELFTLKQRFYHELINSKNLLFPDTEEVLSSLAEHYILALISNTFRSMFNRTFPRHLADLFRITLFADEVTEPKPSPQSLMHVIDALRVKPNECCYIGDSVEDIQMANAAGVKIFSIPTGACSSEELVEAGADRLVSSLKELLRQPEFGSSPLAPEKKVN